eukprot:scaffold38971_cov21-Cyclotella_meneghiniana.AAC.1
MAIRAADLSEGDIDTYRTLIIVITGLTGIYYSELGITKLGKKRIPEFDDINCIMTYTSTRMADIRSGKKSAAKAVNFNVPRELESLANNVKFYTKPLSQSIQGLLYHAVTLREYKLANNSYETTAVKWDSKNKLRCFNKTKQKINDRWDEQSVEVKAVITRISLGYTPEVPGSSNRRFKLLVNYIMENGVESFDHPDVKFGPNRRNTQEYIDYMTIFDDWTNFLRRRMFKGPLRYCKKNAKSLVNVMLEERIRRAEPEFQEIIATDVVTYFRDYHSDVTIEAKYNRVYKANIPPGLKKSRIPDCWLDISYKGEHIVTVFAECDECYHNESFYPVEYPVEDENDKNQWETHAALHNGAKKVIHFRVGTPSRRRLGAYEANNLGRVMKEGT